MLLRRHPVRGTTNITSGHFFRTMSISVRHVESETCLCLKVDKYSQSLSNSEIQDADLFHRAPDDCQHLSKWSCCTLSCVSRYIASKPKDGHVKIFNVFK